MPGSGILYRLANTENIKTHTYTEKNWFLENAGLLLPLVNCPSCIDIVHNHMSTSKHVTITFDNCMVSMIKKKN